MKRQSKISFSSFLSKKWTKNVNSYKFSSQATSNRLFYQFAPIQYKDGEKSAQRCMKQAQEKHSGNTKFRDIILAKNQRIQIKLSREQIRNIFERFGKGCSLEQLTQKYGTIITNIRRVRSMILKQLKLISLAMKWTIGRMNLRGIGMKDHRLFRFIKSRNLDFPNFNQVADYCERYKIIRKSKNEEHRRQRYEINLYLNRFNSLLKAYSKMYQETIKNSSNQAKTPIHQKTINAPPSISCQHLAKVIEQKLQKQQEISLQFNQIDLQDKVNILQIRPTMEDICFQMWSQNDMEPFSCEKVKDYFQIP